MTIILNTPVEICAQLGTRARHARLARNLTQGELAARAGVSLGALRKLEAGGQTTLVTFVKCACALDAASDFENLLAPRLTSIAQMEREEAASLRRRARRIAIEPVAGR
jgi:transcriptional regulator with XRE-family HTH domain